MKKILAVVLVCIFASFAFPGRQTYAAETDKNDRLNYTQHNPVAGDVNTDGELSILDVVLMQRWLLAVPDTELADWKAGDLCADDKLDVFDLCLMKRLLFQSMTHNPLDSLIGMDYEDAVRNDYISKLEYNYQISGNLKSAIEEKMGRFLDYSIDRFYLVNNEKLRASLKTPVQKSKKMI